MILALEFLAVLSAALFAGAALYINVMEHPTVTSQVRKHASCWFAGASFTQFGQPSVSLAQQSIFGR